MPRNLDDSIVLSNYPSWELAIGRSPYDQLNTEAYSNNFDLRSISRKCNRLAYRLVTFSKQSPAEQGYIQYIAPTDYEREDIHFLGRGVNRKEVKTSLLRSWVRRCENFHEDVCEEDGIAGRHLPVNLRLIDVEKKILIKAQIEKHLCYPTLSYVWGAELMKEESGISPVVTNRADLRTNEAGEECTPLPENLPRTIADADDPINEKMIHLTRMDAVYNCSKLTNVAASGLHANSGLPGISVARKYAQSSEMVDSYQMAAMSPSFSELENSRSLKWNTRGWTFLEKLLALLEEDSPFH
ncbi:hypothetical protein LTR70_005534 [Exophiala xenobiotica]|uniref:Heterokaryon incompatibility domain-containing protein n=1 Tax=Lithohypha guttulata TaxID=1690604 RepID=A0ABR0K9K8_9EURO|nr:hypothetical protein LTR24_005248 [Lithohypha guttulata]KAK5318050.1 hypothetical protein LTR70_005534 [Exophiala xenobiotica]